MKLVIISSLLFLASCTHSIHMYNVSEYEAPAQAGQVIKAEAKQHVILDFVFDTNYVDEAYASLKKQCSSRITNINTRYSTSHSFLSWYNKVNITALCVN